MSMRAMTANKPQGLRGKHILFIFLAFFAMFAVANGIFIFVALSTFEGVDRAAAYEEGLRYNDRIAEAKRQAALGWQHKLSLAESGEWLEASFADAAGEPISGLKTKARIERPAYGGGLDIALTFTEHSPGVYRAPLNNLPAGRWVAELTASNGRNLYRIKERLWLSPKQ